MTMTATQLFKGPASWDYRGVRLEMVYSPDQGDKFGVDIVTGGRREYVGPYFLEENARRSAQHCVDLRLAPRAVSQLEIDRSAELDAMAESDR